MTNCLSSEADDVGNTRDSADNKRLGSRLHQASTTMLRNFLHDESRQSSLEPGSTPLNGRWMRSQL